MKRFAVTAFAILYAVMVLGISVSRTSVVAEINAPRQNTGQPNEASIGKAGPLHPHFGQKRILQNQFVVESPLLAVGTLLKSGPTLVPPTDVRVRSLSASSIPSRAPPSLS